MRNELLQALVAGQNMIKAEIGRADRAALLAYRAATARENRALIELSRRWLTLPQENHKCP